MTITLHLTIDGEIVATIQLPTYTQLDGREAIVVEIDNYIPHPTGDPNP